MSNISKKFEPVPYRAGLPSDVRYRYDQKTAVIGIDPYTVQGSEFRRDRMAWPEVSYLDVYTYLVCSTSWYSKTQMKAFKSLDAYKLSQEDWIWEMLHKEINGFHLLRAKVTHSYAVNNTPLEPWVIISKDGAVESAHCTCMAGLAEACTHIAAVLFCLETCARVRSETSPTDLPAYWIFPTTARLDTQFKKLKDIDFQSAAKKRKQKSTLDADGGDEPEMQRPKTSAATKQEEQEFFRKLHDIQPDAVVLSIVPEYARHFEPQASKIGLPPQLHKLFKPDLQTATEQQIQQECEAVILDFTEDQAEVVEMQTRAQRKCRLWSMMRAGRITASNFKAACRTATSKPSLSLLKQVCAPSTSHAGKKIPDAMQRGITHEKDALAAYRVTQSPTHEDLVVKESGLLLNPRYPAFGASPDGLVSCKCCGKGCLEVKCPHKLSKLSATYSDIDWLESRDGVVTGLNTEHEYYYQIQCQLAISGLEYCDLIVFSPHLPLAVVRILLDSQFWQRECGKAALFHKLCVLPELLAKHFSSRKAITPAATTQDNITPAATTQDNITPAATTQDNTVTPLHRFCVCQGLDDGRMMIQCDNKNCASKWFHTECLGMKRIPKGSWLCHACKNVV